MRKDGIRLMKVSDMQKIPGGGGDKLYLDEEQVESV
jgi:hypothetical protein